MRRSSCGEKLGWDGGMLDWCVGMVEVEVDLDDEAAALLTWL